MMVCYICQGKEEVINFPFYTHGSEGTNLCLTCRVVLTGLIRNMAGMAYRGKLLGYKLGKKEGGNKLWKQN
jgi:hypothetical protein